MRGLRVGAIGLLVAASSILGCAQTSVSDAGWTTLIDGATGLDNWNRVGDANWRAQDGAIVADMGKSGYLVTKNSYKDFHVKAEFWADHTTNSGIFIRLSDPAKISSRNVSGVNELSGF